MPGVGAGAGFDTPARPRKPASPKFAACMRKNGVKLPAPNTSGNGPIFKHPRASTRRARRSRLREASAAPTCRRARPRAPAGASRAPPGASHRPRAPSQACRDTALMLRGPRSAPGGGSARAGAPCGRGSRRSSASRAPPAPAAPRSCDQLFPLGAVSSPRASDRRRCGSARRYGVRAPSPWRPRVRRRRRGKVDLDVVAVVGTRERVSARPGTHQADDLLRHEFALAASAACESSCR